MPVPRIAIVGRPNVGKSSLLNMIKGEKVSIVDSTAGTTRDRVTVIVDLPHPDFPQDRAKAVTIELTDTGGFGVYVAEGRRYNEVGADLATLTEDIEYQISQAVASADLVLFVLDAQAGVTPQDEEVARLLRERVLGERGAKRRGGPVKKGRGAKVAAADEDDTETPVEVPKTPAHVIVVANKTDGPRWEAHAHEAASLGFGPPLPVSAMNNYFRRDFVDELYRLVEPLNVRSEEQDAAWAGGVRLAIIGKRNAGKSSLVNALAGEQRVIVSEIAGTTRDAVDVRFEMDGKVFTAIDTAGLRKKKSFADRIEWWAYDRAQRSIERSDVVLLLVDATEAISQVDQQLAAMTQMSYKPVVIVVNKWDLAEGQVALGGGEGDRGNPVTTEMYEEYLRKELKGLSFAPIAFISASAGTNIRQTIGLALEIFEQANQRAPTGQLNRLLRDILDTRGPTSKLGTFAKAYFISQVAMRPPTIVLVVNRPELFSNQYRRFLINRLREALPFPEVPIKLVIKEGKRARLEDLLSGEHQRMKSTAPEREPQTEAEIDAMALEAFGSGVDGPGEEIDLDADLETIPEDAGGFFEDDQADPHG